MQVTIDRFEGDFAIVEMNDGKMIALPRILIPDAREGDIINITIDIEKTEERKKMMKRMMNDLWSD